MTSHLDRDFVLDLAGLLVVVPLLALAAVTTNPLYSSLIYQVAIGIAASMAIYVMLRVGLLSFTVPAFMAVGGYAAAIAAVSGVTNLIACMVIAFLVPCFIALPLGALVLRLRGVYFIFITFVVNEIVQLLLFEVPGITGGANGIAGIPPATLFSLDISSNEALVVVTVTICLVAMLLTLLVTQRFRPEFASVEENETLAESLGVVVWRYRMISFIVSAGVSGLAGYALVNILSTAHPSSFSSWSVNNYVAYVFVGGRGTILGGVVGSALLITFTNIFSGYAQLSLGLFGVLLIIVLTFAPGGIVGTATEIVGRVGAAGRRAGNRKATRHVA